MSTFAYASIYLADTASKVNIVVESTKAVNENGSTGSSTIRRMASGSNELAIERKKRRMIKNRESAARSRARKQAYIAELEKELRNLREENAQLRLILEEKEKNEEKNVEDEKKDQEKNEEKEKKEEEKKEEEKSEEKMNKEDEEKQEENIEEKKEDAEKEEKKEN